jgi:uncharacterized MAPEG superfamily protein
MSREEGLDNEHPRKYVGQLEGLPLRLRSAHYALMENFPGKLFLSTFPILRQGRNVLIKAAFALAAALAQVIAPTDAQVVNLLGFHVIAKLLVHYPAYLSNIVVPRTVAHISATAALINVCWRLAAGN